MNKKNLEKDKTEKEDLLQAPTEIIVTSFSSPTDADFKKVTVKVTGMTCTSCVSSIEKNVGRVEGNIVSLFVEL